MSEINESYMAHNLGGNPKKNWFQGLLCSCLICLSAKRYEELFEDCESRPDSEADIDTTCDGFGPFTDWLHFETKTQEVVSYLVCCLH